MTNSGIDPRLWKHPEEASREDLITMHQIILKRSIKSAKKAALANKRAEELEEKRRWVRSLLWRITYYLGMFLFDGNKTWVQQAANITKTLLDKL